MYILVFYQLNIKQPDKQCLYLFITTTIIIINNYITEIVIAFYYY